MKKIYIACPAYIHSGGPELLHQLCYSLRKQGFSSAMYYYEIKDAALSPVADAYKKYDNPYVTQIDDNPDTVVVIPETGIWLLKKLHRAKRVFWWLSVDNYYVSTARSFGRRLGLSRQQAYKIKEKLHWIDCTRYLLDKDVIHLVQSEYANQHIRNLGIAKERIYKLSDYLNDEFLLHRSKIKLEEKKDIVLYNPRKGMDYTRKIIAYAPDITWIPLQNLTREQMIQHMLKAKVYVDFGNHPGKDRIPREAAVLGCCVITDTDGAAGNDIDVAINKKYKLAKSEANIPQIVDKIKDCFDNYHERQKDFHSYVNSILKEKEEFNRNVKEIFSYGIN